MPVVSVLSEYEKNKCKEIMLLFSHSSNRPVVWIDFRTWIALVILCINQAPDETRAVYSFGYLAWILPESFSFFFSSTLCFVLSSNEREKKREKSSFFILCLHVFVCVCFYFVLHFACTWNAQHFSSICTIISSLHIVLSSLIADLYTLHTLFMLHTKK